MFSRLFKPIDYLRVRHPAKWKYDLILPIGLTLGMFFLVTVMPIKPNILGKDGLIVLINNLMGILVGFFVASLAAVSTFNKEGMDKVIPGTPMTLRVKESSAVKNIKLTRRRYLCLLFGYLAFMSLFLYLFGGGLPYIFSNTDVLLNPKSTMIFKYILCGIYFFIFTNILITTLLGLYYLVDRIHRYEPTLQTGSSDGSDGVLE